MPDQHHHQGGSDTPHDQHVVESLGYEARDILGRRRSIFYYAAIHLGGLVATGILVVGIYWWIAGQSPKFDGPTTQSKPVESAAAKLQAHPGTDMKEFLGKNQAKLHGYGWVDKSKGIVHIPIEKAIEVTADANLPNRPEAPK